MSRTRRTVVLAGMVTAASAVFAPGLAWAQQSPTTGQPGTSASPPVNCTQGTATTEPGHASSSSGSPFNETGSTGGSHYAGSGSGSAHAGSTAAVSQYDIACGRLSS